MTEMIKDPASLPPLGVALWLLSGGTLADRVQWIVCQGFTGVSLLQSVIDCDRSEAADAADAIRAAGLNITYHGNVHHRLTPTNTLDTAFVDALVGDVLFWHRHAGRVRCCCADPIRLPTTGVPRFAPALNRELLQRTAAGLGTHGIAVGLENIFGAAGYYHSIAAIAEFTTAPGIPAVVQLLDAGHTHVHIQSDGVAGEEEIGAFVSALPLEIAEVHLSDNHGRQDEHLALGEGTLDLPALFTALRARGFHGQLTLEVCRNILAGQYAFDITVPGDTDPLLRSRDAVITAWEQTA